MFFQNAINALVDFLYQKAVTVVVKNKEGILSITPIKHSFETGKYFWKTTGEFEVTNGTFEYEIDNTFFQYFEIDY